jgi:hypothetical protein
MAGMEVRSQKVGGPPLGRSISPIGRLDFIHSGEVSSGPADGREGDRITRSMNNGGSFAAPKPWWAPGSTLMRPAKGADQSQVGMAEG